MGEYARAIEAIMLVQDEGFTVTRYSSYRGKPGEPERLDGLPASLDSTPPPLDSEERVRALVLVTDILEDVKANILVVSAKPHRIVRQIPGMVRDEEANMVILQWGDQRVIPNRLVSPLEDREGNFSSISLYLRSEASSIGVIHTSDAKTWNSEFQARSFMADPKLILPRFAQGLRATLREAAMGRPRVAIF